MVEIIEAKDLMGQSKSDFLSKGVPMRYEEMVRNPKTGQMEKNIVTVYLPRAKMWIQLPSPTELVRIAELFGVEAITKRKKDYVFALEGTIYYAKD